MDINKRRENEKKNYDKIYHGKDPYYANYGSHMHAKNCIDVIKKMNINSLIDVGCGKGQFPVWAKKNGVAEVHAIDFSAPPPKETHGVNFYNGWAHELPIEDETVEYVTCFDMMEHLIPEDTDLVLEEFNRVCTKGMIFSISYIPSVTLVDGNNLHPNVKSEKWWIKKLSKYGKVKKYMNYLFVEKVR
jgi:ubiquinone/menaquinone biosynthesis C-methylase UbiE